MLFWWLSTLIAAPPAVTSRPETPGVWQPQPWEWLDRPPLALHLLAGAALSLKLAALPQPRTADHPGVARTA